MQPGCRTAERSLKGWMAACSGSDAAGCEEGPSAASIESRADSWPPRGPFAALDRN